MQIKVKLVGAFKLNRFKEELRDYPAGTSVQDIIDGLQLPEQILGFALINGQHVEFDRLLQDGDQLTILPILEGG